MRSAFIVDSMSLEGLKSLLGRESQSAGNNSKNAPATVTKGQQPTESNTHDDTESGISRPPGWEPMYGTYEKPVYPREKRELSELLQSLDTAADITDFQTSLPPFGTNEEHIELRVYTVTAPTGERTLVIDTYIHNFSNWTPEEKDPYEYPEDTLSNNGPYYMHLADDLEKLFRVGPFSFEFVAYDEAEDLAIYSAEVAVYRLEN